MEYKFGDLRSQLCSTRNTSGGSWPIIRANSLWESHDEDNEFFYNEALLHFADKLQDDRERQQTKLDQWIPRKGNYINSTARYQKIVHKPRDNNGIYSLRFNDDATLLLVGYENGVLEVIDLLCERSVPVKLSVGSNYAPSSIKCNPKKTDEFLISTTGGNIFRCYLEPSDMRKDNWQLTKIICESKNETYGMDINSTGEKLITGGKDSRIRVYDLETNDIVSCYRGFAMECKDSYARLLEEDEEEGHYLQIYSIVTHPDNPWVFASAGLDSNIKIWDLRVKQFAVKNIFGPHIMGDAIDLKGYKVLSGQWASKDGLQIWDSRSCRLLKTFSPTNLCPQSFGQYFYCAKFLKCMNQKVSEDLVLAGGAGMGGLVIGSITEDLIVSLYEDDGSILCLDNHEDMLAYGGTNHKLYISQFIHNYYEVRSDSEYSSAYYVGELTE